MKTTVKKAKSILSKIVRNQLADGTPPPVMLWGAPGIGKSDIVKAVARELEIELRDIRLAQLDPVDLRGVPTVAGGQTKWATPSCFPTDPKSAGIIFLDELSAADPSIQVAAYQLLLDRRVGEYIKGKRIRPDVLLFFTDGDGRCPQDRPDYPVLWLLTENGEPPVSWGVHIKMKG